MWTIDKTNSMRRKTKKSNMTFIESFLGKMDSEVVFEAEEENFQHGSRGKQKEYTRLQNSHLQQDIVRQA